MSSDEEDLDLNDDTTSQLDNATDDGMDTEEPTPSAQNSPSPQLNNSSLALKRRVNIQLNPDTLTSQSYDCVPHVAAIHTSPIYSLASTRCYRWVLTGSEDGYVRKWDFFASMNGKTMLTQVQKHHQADSVTMAGILSSWWENEEQPEPVTKTEPVPGETPEASSLSNVDTKLSPVFSMDVHSEALWALQGVENGSINLVTVRHDEGKCHHVLRKHSGPVSVLRIMPGETGAISGSWDKSVLEWDLNTGAVTRNYAGHSSQLVSAAFQPLYTPFVPPPPVSGEKSTTETDPTADIEIDPGLVWDQKNPNILLTTSIDGECRLWDRREPDKDARRLGLPDRTPPWCLSACWSADGSKIYAGRRNGTVDEYDYASQKHIQTFKMPGDSGQVSYVAAMPNGKHIICASNDNMRLWNTAIDTPHTIRPDQDPAQKPAKASSAIPFSILPGHRGGCISHISIDPTCRYMITTSGNRGWDASPANTCLFYDITPIMQ